MSNQIALPTGISFAEIARKQSFGGAIELCLEAGGFDLDKQAASDLNLDKAQLSRWQSGKEGITWPKLERVMDTCGNDAPVLWQLHRRGYDLSSLRKRETETEKKLREAEERIRELEHEREITMKVLREVRP